MKVAIFSDVQANLPAMEAAIERILAWRPDLVIMDGDLLNRGPSSLACLERFDALRRAHGWLPVQGNHETWIQRCREQPPRSALDAEMRRFADWTLEQVRPRLDALDGWPDHLCFDHGRAGWVHVTHGSMLGNRHGITARLSDAELRKAMAPEAALFVTAHTHRPLSRWIDGRAVLNVGSVGSPFDGDTRGSLALLEARGGRWRWTIERFNYDRERARRDFLDSGFIENGGPLARILYEEWSRARSLMPHWRRAFEASVLAGDCDLAQSVERFLQDLD